MKRFAPGADPPGMDPGMLAAHQVNEHWQTAGARCSIWWDAVPALPGERLGVVGHYFREAPDAGREILGQALTRLREAGCTLAVGPMDGNTWRRYRLVTDAGNEPPFFMEPTNPPDWPGDFLSAGFAPMVGYSSSLVTDLGRRDERVERARERLTRDGVNIRTLNEADFSGDLRRIYDVSVVSFVRNVLYTELPAEAFLQQYLPYRRQLRPELVFLAERGGEPVGFLFAVPDLAQARRGEPVTTVIGKTLAVRPGRAQGGLGLVLISLLHERSAALGYRRVIHALQYDGNQVRNMSGFFGSVMRRYTLYSCRLS